MTVNTIPRFQLVPKWEQLPIGMVHGDVSDVAVDAEDNVYLLTNFEARVIVYSPTGEFLRSFGEGKFCYRPHGITIAGDKVYITDQKNHVILIYTRMGEPIGTLGTFRQPSDSGIDRTLRTLTQRVASIKHGAPPYNLPTQVAVAPNGDLYVSDGYGNCRVHQLTPEGEVIRSWGEPGDGPGEFHVVHYVYVTRDGRVLVCDRDNERIQVFTLAGKYIEEWTDLDRPAAVVEDKDGVLFVAEQGWKLGHGSFKRGKIERQDQVQLGGIAVLDSAGRVLERWGGRDPSMAGSFVAPHGLAVDSRGDLYVAEINWTIAGQLGKLPANFHTFQKFARQ